MHLQTVRLFIITFFVLFCFFGERVWLTSPLPFPLSSFPSLFLFSDRFETDLRHWSMASLPHFLTRHFLLSQGAFLAAVHFILHQPNRSAEGERLTSFCLLVRSPSLRFERTDAHERKPINCPLCGSFSKRPITWSKHDVVHAGIWSVARKRVIKFITADP